MINLFKTLFKPKFNDVKPAVKHPYVALFSELQSIKTGHAAPESVDLKRYVDELNTQLENITKSLKVKSTNMAMDSVSDMSYYNNANYNINDPILRNNLFPGFAQLAMLAQVPIIGNACTVYKDDMFRSGYKFVSTDDDDDKSDLIKLLKDRFKGFGIDQLLQDCTLSSFVLGGCMIYPKLKQNSSSDDLTTPIKFTKSTIAKGDLEYLTCVKPIYCTPTQVNYADPLALDFYIPSMYTAMGQEMHCTRLIKMIYNEQQELIRPMYQFYGLSLTQKILEAVRDFTNIKDIIKEIINRFNLTVFKVPLTAAMEESTGRSDLITRVKDFIATKTNFGVMLTDKDNEDIMQLQMSLAGLDELLSRYTEIMCITTQIPASKLLGIQPKGFSNNDKSGDENWCDLIDGLRQNMLKPVMMQILHLIMLNEGLDIDPAIEIEFGKLMETNKLEDAQIAELNSRTDTNYINAGVLSPRKVTETIAVDPESKYNNIDVGEDFDDDDYMAKERDVKIDDK